MEISFNDYVEKLEGIYGNNLGIEDCLAHIILSEYGKEIVEIEKIEIRGFQSEGTKIFSKHLDKRYNGMLQSNKSGCIQIKHLL
jgi:hypothetical protein